MPKYEAKRRPNYIYASGDAAFFKFNPINVKVSLEPHPGYLDRSRVSQDRNRINKHENGIKSHKGNRKDREGVKQGQAGEEKHFILHLIAPLLRS